MHKDHQISSSVYCRGEKLEVYEIVKKPSKNIVALALICITILEAIALFKGINGILLTAVISIIAGVGGYVLPSPYQKK
jgi:hypothetical protein